MFSDLFWLVPCFIIFVIILVLIVVFTRISWQNKVKKIKEELDLIEGCTYNVTQNSGRTLKNLVFVKIESGNQSKNGNINLIFLRNSKYRNEDIQKEIVVKYGSIWKVEKVD